MNDIGSIIAFALMASFLLHFIGIIPLALFWALFGYDWVDNLTLVKKIETVKSSDLRQLIYFPILSLMGAGFVAVLSLYTLFCRSHSILQNLILGISILSLLIVQGRKNYILRHANVS